MTLIQPNGENNKNVILKNTCAELQILTASIVKISDLKNISNDYVPECTSSNLKLRLRPRYLLLGEMSWHQYNMRCKQNYR